MIEPNHNGKASIGHQVDVLDHSRLEVVRSDERLLNADQPTGTRLSLTSTYS